MNYINALIVCWVSNTPVKFAELRNIRKNKKEIEPFIRSIVQLNKGDVAYDRQTLTDYFLEKGNIDNVSYGLILARKNGKILTLTEAIELDKKGINLLEKYKK